MTHRLQKFNFEILFLGRPETVVKCISMIYDILDKVPPKGSEQRYDPNCFDQTYDYGGKNFSGHYTTNFLVVETILTKTTK